MVEVLEQTPGDVAKFSSDVKQRDPESHWCDVLDRIAARMKPVWDSKGANYAAVELVTAADFRVLNDERAYYELTKGLPLETQKRIDYCRRFLLAAGRGCVFYQRKQPQTFVAYEMAFEVGAGHVLLDATADLAGMVALMEGAKLQPPPRASFENLSIVHIPTPPEFNRRKQSLNELLDYRSEATKYADWMKETILQHSEPGERVLVVAPKKIFTAEYFPTAENPERPARIHGRLVSTLHWGVGIGSNLYKNATAVFLFHEHHLPRSQYGAEALGFRRRPLVIPSETEETLPGEGITADGEDFVASLSAGHPTGDVLTAKENHLLRWFKQEAARGNMRNFDPDGRCGRMKLVVTMDRKRLLTHYRRLFPGCPPPVLLKATETKTPRKDGKRGRGDHVTALVDLLRSTDKTELTANDVGRELGIAPKYVQDKLVRHKVVQAVCEETGFRFVPGGRGRGRQARFTRQAGVKAAA